MEIDNKIIRSLEYPELFSGVYSGKQSESSYNKFKQKVKSSKKDALKDLYFAQFYKNRHINQIKFSMSNDFDTAALLFKDKNYEQAHIILQRLDSLTK